jgi:tripartite-type tricarboxylate transporter receptor subunit TctC
MPNPVSRRSIVIVAAAAIAAIGPAVPLSAQSYPDRPIRFFVPFPAGGSTDAVARAMQPALEKILGQPVVVENRAGAGGTLGVDAVAKAPPDGYTIGIAGAGALGVNIGERTKRMYDPANDLAPISRAAESPFILVATPSLNASSLADVVKLAKAEPNRMSIGHGGNGTAMQLAAMMFVIMADVKINLVPYRGTAPAVSDAIAGHVQLAIADPPPSMGAIADGKLRRLRSRRSSASPCFPTCRRSRNSA